MSEAYEHRRKSLMLIAAQIEKSKEIGNRTLKSNETKDFMIGGR